jgi:class 3 adenylate cyclase/tetratricopeptide (TPR) repeat protein
MPNGPALRSHEAEASASPDPVLACLRPYVPRVVQAHVAREPDARAWIAKGTAVLVDISGFTALSEQLARRGREGAEQIADIVGISFEAMLALAYENGAGLLKFGGDAMLLWFEGKAHAARACRAAHRMRAALPEVSNVEMPDAQVALRMAQAIHSGDFHFFTVGASHVEFLPVGPSWSVVATMEQLADGGEILASAATSSLVPDSCLGDVKGDGRLVVQAPAGIHKSPRSVPPAISPDLLGRCLSPPIREHVLAGGGASEHRPVTIAFVRFEGTDALIEAQGTEAAAGALDRFVRVVAAAAEAHRVTFLGSDVDHDGGKLILVSGAPKAMGNDEERMLLALRSIIAGNHLPLGVRIGVHRGAVFAGDIGPVYRRTYTIMGDAVNLTARLMAQATPGCIFATGEVLERCNTAFETSELTPLVVKGKAQALRAWSVGRALSARLRQVSVLKLPLTGRNAELGSIRKAYVSARGGAGRLIEVVGDAGVGKSRLLEALRDAAAGFRKYHAACEAYTASVPYAFWRGLLRDIMGFGRDEPDVDVVAGLRDEIARRAPELRVWLPLVAIALDVEVAATPEVQMLAERNRRARLHESVAAFLAAVLPEPTLIEIEDAHNMDQASAELLAHLGHGVDKQAWLIAVARRPVAGGFSAPDGAAVVRVPLAPLAAPDALRMAQLAAQQTPLPSHVLEVIATRSGGNPQFLRDLLRNAIESGGTAALPDSAEAAAMAQIDALAPDDRALVRRAAIFGSTFHPRMLAWLAEDGNTAPFDPSAWQRLGDLFVEDGDGYLQFRQSLLRDAAYAGLPFKTRRRLHALVAAHIEQELDFPDEAAGTLALHYFEAGDLAAAWRYANVAAQRAAAAYADVDAARFYARAIEAGKQLAELPREDIASAHQAMGDALVRAGEHAKALAAYTAAQSLTTGVPLVEAGLLLRLAQADGRLGRYSEGLRRIEEARAMLQGVPGEEAARLVARGSARYAMFLQAQGRTAEALEWAQRAVAESHDANDAEALGDAYHVVGWAYGQLGRDGALGAMQQSLEAYERAGNRVRQAALLSDLGVICHWEGRWDEAFAYWERSRYESLKIGSTMSASAARVNVAEIMVDRGEWADAEAVLLETLSFWRSSQFRLFLAACLSLLGRASLRLGRLDQAKSRLEEARATFIEVGAEQEVPAMDARLAECRLAGGDAQSALEAVNGLLAHAKASSGVARVTPLLERIKAHALLTQGDLWSARDALEASLAAAREQRNSFEAALTTLSLIELDRLEEVEPPLEMVSEARMVLANLKVRAVPPVPLPAG